MEPPRQVVEPSSLPMITNLLRMCTTVAPRAIIVVRPHFETGMLTILPLRLDLRLGAAGIINRLGRDL